MVDIFQPSNVSAYTRSQSSDEGVVKVQIEALAESSVVFGRVFGNKVGRRLTV